MESEKELLEDIKTGNRQALHHLYNRYVGYAMAIAKRYTPDQDDANEIIQESFVKILTSIQKFEYRGEGSLKGWLLRIVANESVSYVKRKGRFTFVENFPDEPDDGTPDVERVPQKVLNRLIGELPTGYRLVLNMYVFEQKSHKEIAEQLGIKEATSASQYLRAKKLLARKIKDYLNNNEYE